MLAAKKGVEAFEQGFDGVLFADAMACSIKCSKAFASAGRASGVAASRCCSKVKAIKAAPLRSMILCGHGGRQKTAQQHDSLLCLDYNADGKEEFVSTRPQQQANRPAEVSNKGRHALLKQACKLIGRDYNVIIQFNSFREEHFTIIAN